MQEWSYRERRFSKNGRIIAATFTNRDERAHARSGNSAKIAGYLGAGETFNEAVADFSIAYADQSERDHELMVKAVPAGKLEVFVEGD